MSSCLCQAYQVSYVLAIYSMVGGIYENALALGIWHVEYKCIPHDYVEYHPKHHTVFLCHVFLCYGFLKSFLPFKYPKLKFSMVLKKIEHGEKHISHGQKTYQIYSHPNQGSNLSSTPPGVRYVVTPTRGQICGYTQQGSDI